MISIISEQRGPRLDHSSPHTSKSSGHGLRPTPRPTRLSAMTAAVLTVFATSSGLRTGSFSTLVHKRMRWVRMAMAGMSAQGSMKGVSPTQ